MYEVATGLGWPGQAVKPGKPWPDAQLLMDASVAYHFHFVNVGRDRSRDRFINDATIDTRAQETVVAMLDTPRGRVWQRRAAALKAQRDADPAWAATQRARAQSRKDRMNGSEGTERFTPPT